MSVLSIKDLVHSYPGGFTLRALTLNFSGVCGVYGPNGAGKTTLFRCIAGMIKPKQGSFTLDDQALDQNHSLVGYCPESDYFMPRLSLREGLTLYSWAKLGSSTAWHGCDHLIDSLGLHPHLDKPFGACSTGTRKKIQIVATLIGQPPVLILDEPHNGVDMAANEVINRLLSDLHKKGKIILMSSHLALVLNQLSDSFYRVKDGTITMTEGVEN